MQEMKQAIELGTILGRHEQALSEMVQYLESIDTKLSSICDCVYKHETEIQCLKEQTKHYESECNKEDDKKKIILQAVITMIISIFTGAMGFFWGHAVIK